MRTTVPTPFVAGALPTGARTPGKQLCTLVRWAVDTRTRLMKWGWSHQDMATAQRHVLRLQQWLGAHVDASKESILRFDAELGESLRYVMPGNAAGKAKLAEYQRILFNL